MQIIKKAWIIGSIGLVIFGINCGSQKIAKGPADVIYVLASDPVRSAVQTGIDTSFSYGIRAPEFQPYFRTDWRALKHFPQYAYFPNLILVADMNREDMAAQVVRRLLSEEQLKSLARDSVAMFAIEDHWRKRQMFVLVAGYDLEKLSDYIIANRAWLFRKFDQQFVEHQKRYIFNQYEQKTLPRKFWKEYGWTMRIQADYVVIKESPARNFVWIGRNLPYRWISISWKKGMQTAWLTANGLYAKREEIGDLYGNICTEKRFLGHHFTRFGQWEALKMTGLWYHQEKAQGGPFCSYAFYDAFSDRTFFIDMMVYAPGEQLTVYLRQMEIMMKTFSTNPERSESQT